LILVSCAMRQRQKDGGLTPLRRPALGPGTKRLTAPGGYGLIRTMYARRKQLAIAVNRGRDGARLRALAAARDLLLLGALLALLLRMGAGAG